MAAWLVRLKGHPFDLAYLSTTFDAPKRRIHEREGCHYLQSSDFEVLTDAEDVRLHAQSLLQLMNGAARVQSGEYQPVAVDAVVRVDDDGTRQVSMSLSGAVSMRSQFSATVIKGGTATPLQSSTDAQAFLAVAEQHAKVQEALCMFGALDPTWANLHKVFECIQFDVGGTMFAEGWTTKGEANRFTQTANSAFAIGDAARHPRDEQKFRPPKQPMSLSEAQSFIRTLLSHWMRSKRQEVG